jgi:glycosyltransferase involved in cell wall biosynthesis
MQLFSEIIYTIIVPFKGSLNLLERLKNSIPIRDDLEVIIEEDMHDKGAGFCRNRGIEKANGKWLIFADSDDFFTKQFSDILDKYKNNKEDIIYFTPFSVYNDNLEKEAFRHQRLVKLVKENKEELRYRFISPWSKFFKKDFLIENNIHFEEIVAGNDIMFSILSGHKANNILASSEIFYINTVRKGSLVFSKNKNFMLSRFNAVITVNIFLKSIKKAKYQIDTVKFILQSFDYGIATVWLVIKTIIIKRQNPFVRIIHPIESIRNFLWYSKVAGKE